MLTDALHDRADAVLADFSATVALLVDVVRRDRALARTVLDGGCRASETVGAAAEIARSTGLRQLARRPYPPRQG